MEEVECKGVASCLGLINRHVACSQFSASVLLKDVGVPFITKAESHSDDSLGVWSSRTQSEHLHLHHP